MDSERMRFENLKYHARPVTIIPHEGLFLVGLNYEFVGLFTADGLFEWIRKLPEPNLPRYDNLETFEFDIDLDI